MTYLRHATRHVQQTVLDRIRAGLVTDEWLDVANGGSPFGGNAVLWQPGRMKESELVGITTEGSIVAPWFASEPEPVPQEIGGGLVMVSHALVIDVVGESDGVSLAITSDIMDRLTGGPGLLILAVATPIGLIPVFVGSRRLNCLGVLLLPVALGQIGLALPIARALGLV